MKHKNKMYEIMFLLPPSKGTAEEACETVRKLLQRRKAEIVILELWEERKLAYKIGQYKQGLYIICYCRMDPQNIASLEYDCTLTEDIIRLLVLRREGLTEEQARAEFDNTMASRQGGDSAGLRDNDAHDSDTYEEDGDYENEDSDNDYNDKNVHGELSEETVDAKESESKA